MMTVVSAMLVGAGSLFCLIAAIGLFRLPDFLSRTHAASLAGLPGTGLILLGVAVSSPALESTLLSLAGGVFLVLAGPLGSHLLARSVVKRAE